jgi:hypothetical protein
VFQPAVGAKSVGYVEQRLEAGRYRVTFRGGPGAPIEQVADYALLRAAELTLADGYDWFRVTDHFTEERANNGPRLSVGTGGADYGRHSSVGVGVGTSFDLGGGPRLSHTLTILMGKGPKPDDRDAYDARDVRATIGPRT